MNTLAEFLPSVGDGGIKKRARPQTGDERVVRGTTPFRLTRHLIKKPAGAATGLKKPASLNSGTTKYWFIPFALITVATPARATRHTPFHPATPRSIQR